jgi:hypothetical protein
MRTRRGLARAATSTSRSSATSRQRTWSAATGGGAERPSRSPRTCLSESAPARSMCHINHRGVPRGRICMTKVPAAVSPVRPLPLGCRGLRPMGQPALRQDRRRTAWYCRKKRPVPAHALGVTPPGRGQTPTEGRSRLVRPRSCVSPRGPGDRWVVPRGGRRRRRRPGRPGDRHRGVSPRARTPSTRLPR